MAINKLVKLWVTVQKVAKNDQKTLFIDIKAQKVSNWFKNRHDDDFSYLHCALMIKTVLCGLTRTFAVPLSLKFMLIDHIVRFCECR
jgi:hypothetical protein